MTRVLYPGSFDPIHNGHLELIEVAASLFDSVLVATIGNPQKTVGLFSLAERLEMINESIAHLPNVEAVAHSSLVVDLARETGSDFIVVREVGVAQADDPKEPLEAALILSTYFKASDGR